MAHEFIIKRNGILETYLQFEDIPSDFEHVIKFLPEIPEGPHTEDEHDEIDIWNDRLQQLLRIERENASRN